MRGCDRLITKLVFLGLSIPILLLLVSNVNATDESLYNGDRGIEGKIFCDIQEQETGSKSGCYDRNDNPEEYCIKHPEHTDFCNLIDVCDDDGGVKSTDEYCK